PALACLLLGTAPLWFLAALAMYGSRAAGSRNFRLDLPLKMLVPLGGSLMDLEARLRYPQWTEGQKLVMISEAVPDAAAQVAAVARQVRHREQRLGRATGWRIRWVRGPLLGLEPHAIFRLGIGTRPGREPLDAEELPRVDRHEVAHCVITSLNHRTSE